MATYTYTTTKVRSRVNFSETPLGAGETFTGAWELTPHSDMIVNCLSDVAGTLYVDLSFDDGTNFSTLPAFKCGPGAPEFHRILKAARFNRVRYVNGPDAQTSFNLLTVYGDFGIPNSPLNGTIQSDSDAVTVRSDNIEEVMRGKVQGQYLISKFARNIDVDAAEDIWNGGGDYTGFPTTAAEEFQVFSSDAADTAAGTGARTVRFFYLDDDYNMFDANGDQLYFDVTMNGVTPVNSGVTGMRIYTGRVLTSGAGQTNAGSITCRWITTTTVIFAVMPIGFGRTQISNFTIPVDCAGYLTRYSFTMDDNTANSGEVGLKVREADSNTFQIQRPATLSTTRNVDRRLYGGVKFDAKTDFCGRVLSVTNANAKVTFDYDIRLDRSI